MDKPLDPSTWPAVWDLIVVGGGATGLGCAVDAATRGLRVLLLETQQFGQGTSGRSSKLAHGGVRYLAQGRLGLVRQALHERSLLCANAPGLVWPLPFVVPVFAWGQGLYHWLGLKLYQALAGKRSLGPTRWLTVAQVLQHLPALAGCKGLRGGVLYMDAQFDEQGLLAALAATARRHGAVLLENASVQGIELGQAGGLFTVRVDHAVPGAAQGGFTAQTKVVVNAAGPWVDDVRAKVRVVACPQAALEPRVSENLGPAPALAQPLLHLSQGAHVLLPKRFFAGKTALLVPRTPDGRVLFVLPWQGQVLVGTTETPVAGPSFNPQPSQAEIDFLLQTAAPFLSSAPTQADVLHAFAGLRPLLGAAVDGGGAGQGTQGHGSTQGLSREHCVLEELPGFITVAGGKWTTYRKMAEDTVDVVCARLGVGVGCVTHKLNLRD